MPDILILQETLYGNHLIDMEIILIGAVDKKFHIGRGNSIPWDIPLDRRLFRHFTLNHSVIMGRRTFEAIKLPLERRKNIILTKNHSFKAEGCFIAYSVEEALKLVDGKKVFIIGGEMIYRLFLPFSDKIYLTHIDAEFDGDKFFPHIGQDDWKISLRKSFYNRDFKLDFIIYQRRQD